MEHRFARPRCNAGGKTGLSDKHAPTPSQTVGPFFGFALPFQGDSDAARDGGGLRIEGQLLDGAGDPVPDGLLEAWCRDDFARCRTDLEGVFHFNVAKPSRESMAAGDAPHLNVTVFARGLLRHLATRIYFPDEEAANSRDRILNRVEPARRSTLVAQRDGSVLRFDIRLQGDRETVFFGL
jgi:protocatechuate 3,4-dioxygenase, alpha subunit